MMITSLDDPKIQVYNNLNEPQLKHYYEPEEGLFICESVKVIHRALDAGYEPESLFIRCPQSGGGVNGILERCPAVPVYEATEEVMKQVNGYHLTGGILCALKRKRLLPVEELCRDVSRVAVLEDVENPTNVGAIFRSAAAMGMDAVLLTPRCSDPLYRRAARVSMGTVFQVPWTFYPEGSYTEVLHRMGFKTAALALPDSARRIDESPAGKEEKLAVFLGNEDRGLGEDTLRTCDYVIQIPMAHGVDSLNVAAASAVAFWELRKRDTSPESRAETRGQVMNENL